MRKTLIWFVLIVIFSTSLLILNQYKLKKGSTFVASRDNPPNIMEIIKNRESEAYRVCKQIDFNSINGLPLKPYPIPEFDSINDVGADELSAQTVSDLNTHINKNSKKYFSNWEKVMVTLYGQDFYLKNIKVAGVHYYGSSYYDMTKGKILPEDKIILTIRMVVEYSINIGPGWNSRYQALDNISILINENILPNQKNIGYLIDKKDFCLQSFESSIGDAPQVQNFTKLKPYKYYVNKLAKTCDRSFSTSPLQSVINFIERKSVDCSGLIIYKNNIVGNSEIVCSVKYLYEKPTLFSNQYPRKKGTIDLESESIVECYPSSPIDRIY